MKKLNSMTLSAATWYLAGNFAIKGLNFLSVMIFTRMMSVDSYGIYNTYLVYESLMTGIMALGLNSTVKPAKYHYHEEFVDYLKTISVITVSSSMIMGLLLAVLSVSLLHNVTGGIISVIFMWLCATGNCLSNILIQKCIIENKYKLYVFINFLFNIPQIIFSIILIRSFESFSSYEMRLTGHAVPMFVLLLVCAAYLFIHGRFSRKYLKYSMVMGLPMVISSMSSTILTQSDRLIVQKYCGDTETGLYSGVNYVGSILYIIMLSLSNIWDEWFYKKINNNQKDEIREKMKIYVMAFTVVVCGIIAVGPEIIKIFLAPEYSETVPALIPLALSWLFVFLYTLVSTMELVHKKAVYTAVGTGLGAVINILLNIIFVPLYGYVAASYTTLFSYAALLAFHIVIERRVCKSGVYSLKLILTSICASCILSVFCSYTVDYPLLRYIIIVLAMILISIKMYNTRSIKNKGAMK